MLSFKSSHKSNFWTIAIVCQLILLSVLVYYIQKVRSAITSADASGIKRNFKIVDILTVCVVLLTYGLYIAKFVSKSKKEKRNICLMTKMNLSLMLVLLVFVSQTRSALSTAEKGPVPVSFLSDNFNLTEKLSYVILGFNLLTRGAMMFIKNSDKFNLSAK